MALSIIDIPYVGYTGIYIRLHTDHVIHFCSAGIWYNSFALQKQVGCPSRKSSGTRDVMCPWRRLLCAIFICSIASKSIGIHVVTAMSSDSWTSITSREGLEESVRGVFEWCKEHPIRFSAYATFILLSLFPVFVFLLFTICSVIGTVLLLALILLIGLILLAGVCSIVLCCSGCVAACVTVAYLIASVVLRGVKWLAGWLVQ